MVTNSCAFPVVPVDSIASELENLHLIYFKLCLYFELLILVASGIWVVVALVVFQRTDILHVNSHRIIANVLVQYIFFHLIARIVEIAFMFQHYYYCKEAVTLVTDYKSAHHPTASPFYWTNLVKVYFIMLGAFTLPAFVSERFCATIFVSDYESNTRSYISISLGVVLNFISVLYTGLDISALWNKYLEVALIVVANVTALIVSYYCYRRSVQFYVSNITVGHHNHKIHYSLSERYLCAQNIRIAKILRKLIISAGVFNIFLAVIFILRLSSKGFVPLHMNYELFDIILAVYAGLIPFIIYHESKIFQREIRMIAAQFRSAPTCICSKFGSRRNSNAPLREHSTSVCPASQIPSLENVLGVKLTYKSPQHETEVYFAKLEQLWQQTLPANL
ncbi:sre G protein-coupled chemoreceptor domain-containing protein [Ditylenchus destructor]|uniref:Sre G protein-coupled chemoreceptor domain-containing protein n=1 Tax=Ditylenchus destructor TaxID=166010 RepID=A0AAD4NCH4_9BILA|nr:sre G protein-coupled chemoreceptor domain-containing protein [Ditylenchus destructor]